jgi:hypothetical protein
MRSRMLWLGLAALVVVLVASTAAFAATRRTSTGAKVPGTRAGAGVCGALLRDPAALKVMQGLRAEHQADMRAWLAQYGAGPNSPAAQAALTKLRAEHRSDMLALMRSYGIDVRSGSSMMGGASYGSSGMMGGF